MDKGGSSVTRILLPSTRLQNVGGFIECNIFLVTERPLTCIGNLGSAQDSHLTICVVRVNQVWKPCRPLYMWVLRNLGFLWKNIDGTNTGLPYASPRERSFLEIFAIEKLCYLCLHNDGCCKILGRRAVLWSNSAARDKQNAKPRPIRSARVAPARERHRSLFG